jgi:hypothetical protein
MTSPGRRVGHSAKRSRSPAPDFLGQGAAGRRWNNGAGRPATVLSPRAHGRRTRGARLPPHRAPHPRGIRPVRKLPRPGTIAPGAETGAAGAQRRPARAGAPGTSRNAQRQRRTSKLRSPRRGGVHGPAVRVRGADRGGRRGHISPSRPGRAPGAAGSGAPRPTARTPVGFRTLPAEGGPPEARIPPAQVRDLLQLVHRAAPAVTSPRVASGAQ